MLPSGSDPTEFSLSLVCFAVMKLKAIISRALDGSISSEEYESLLNQYAEEGKTSGKQNEDLVYYTKLNAQRSRRVAKTVEVNADLRARIQEIQGPAQWLLITETWCGDAANSVPILSKALESNPHIDLRIVLRDENPDLMDHFMTNGGRSIPKLIALDKDLNVLFTWGPRPQELQKMYDDWRFSEDSDKLPFKEYQVVMQKWYNQNKGEDLQKELLEELTTKLEYSSRSDQPA